MGRLEHNDDGSVTEHPPFAGPIIDDARGIPITSTSAFAILAEGMARGDNPPPMATCPADGEPLIGTMERRGAEFCCLICGRWYGFLAPTPAVETPELTARYAELYARWRAGERPA